ncbi:MAG: metal ABC transporter solute-binding protein, Zn/Mn family [Candidatus Poseidoniaceae archaeon]
MRSTWHRALLVSFLLIMSSLAGCLGGDEDESDEGTYGTVMVSTYHIGEIVKAITGDSVNVEMMSTKNIPVHDYEPSLNDIVRLSDADLFLYHGLGLEPWVEDTLEGLGSDAPEYDMVHTMPTGEISLDFKSILVDQLCESLSNPSAEVIHMLAEDPEDAEELHGDDGAHNLGFPHDDHDEDHDADHGEHDGDHDVDHGDHDEHDHGEHTMLMPEDTLTASSDCPAGTTISVYHMEAGEYMLEFEGEDVESFKMAIAQMMGAHHHHDHGDHGDDDHDGDDDDREDHDDHDDHDDDREDHDEHDGHDGHGDDRDEHDGHDGHDDHDEEFHADEMMPVWDTNNDSLLSWDEFVAGVESMEDEDHNACHNTLTHETTSDNETTCGAYSYYENYSMGGQMFTGCYNVMTHQTTSDNESACGAYTWMDPSDHGHDDHDEHHEEMHHAMVLVYPDGTSVMIEAEHDMLPENASANDFTHMGLTESNISYDIVEDSTYGNYTNAIGGFAAPSDYSWFWQLHVWNESAESWETSTNGMDLVMMEDAEHIAWAPNSTDDSMIPSPEGEHDDHDDHDEHDFEHEMEMAMFGYFFDEADADGDMMLDLAEFESMAEALESQGDDMEMDIVVHIYMEIFDEDGNDALSLGEFTEMMEMMTEMGDDRDEHDDHDHGDHDEDEMVCYDISTHTVDHSYTNQADCESAGLMWTAANSGPGGDDDHGEENMTEMAEMMFNMFDANEDGSLSESELHELFEGMGMDGHEEGVAFIGLHIEREGEYGIALPEGVELHVLMRGGHDGHDDHAGHDDNDDHADEDDHDDHNENGEEELAYDPHSWLDPVAVAAQVDVVLENLIEVFPDGEDLFKENANDFKVELAGLDAKFSSLADCSDRTVAANHNAYSYIAYRYDIDFVTVHGLDPEGEPSPADILKVVEYIDEKGLTVLFIEEYTSEDSVESIVEQTGVEVKILYTMEMAPKNTDDNYLTLMEKNFDSLEEGMTCSA